ncbi:hypothetical protein [Halalkalibacter alkalisediminis]|uniref:Uncharacterized protein n=1 Tax=Halalkalibacter alkalisediminis TaxID=935616 RepID=A0ABV6NQ38_9BACI|nr:hypothetical protein [Halalkalibacter alkalisediminis]
MGQATQENPYSKELSDNYMMKRKLENKRAREKALKALKNTNKNEYKKAGS